MKETIKILTLSAAMIASTAIAGAKGRAVETTSAMPTALSASTPSDMLVDEQVEAQPWLIRAGDVAGSAIYTLPNTTAENWDEAWRAADLHSNAVEIGEIEDVVFNNDGDMKGVVVGVGGFLSFGKKQVIMPLSDLKMIALEDDSFAYLTWMSEADLNDMAVVNSVF
ncbi:PRC-barrel domain-containing protein [Cognatishimia maritima]|uniref:PRC-barrel domain-containing protein n=1 Tax=Cognatishimia maritima TaxID=870908 RepID=A0A1M5PK43_9RHOB|nr:PRC-barrel domain-containing protein [Cognatishimia maritima]SHH02115.1 PRC-barrel domain-containing protein [Cognatishimia maritima]